MTPEHDAHTAGFRRPPLDFTSAEVDLVESIRDLGAGGDRLIRDISLLIKSLPRVPRRLMSDREKDYRIRSGVYTVEQIAEAEREIRGGALQSIAIRGRVSAAWETVSLETVVRFLGLTVGEIGTRIERRELFSVAIGGETRFPAWQLSSRPVRQIIPGLRQALLVMPDWDPRQISNFFTTRHDGLVDTGRKSPAAWLEDGGDPSVIVEILESEDYR